MSVEDEDSFPCEMDRYLFRIPHVLDYETPEDAPHAVSGDGVVRAICARAHQGRTPTRARPPPARSRELGSLKAYLRPCFWQWSRQWAAGRPAAHGCSWT